MRTIRRLSLVTMAALAPALWAAEVPYDFVACTHAKATMLEASADIVAYSAESWGVVSSSTTKDFEGATTHCHGYARVIAGKQVGKGVCKWFDASGNTALGEYDIPASGNNSFTWLVGTGKFKGLTGGGSFATVFSGKPSDAGTSQGCRHDWGKITLP